MKVKYFIFVALSILFIGCKPSNHHKKHHHFNKCPVYKIDSNYDVAYDVNDNLWYYLYLIDNNRYTISSYSSIAPDNWKSISQFPSNAIEEEELETSNFNLYNTQNTVNNESYTDNDVVVIEEVTTSEISSWENEGGSIIDDENIDSDSEIGDSDAADGDSGAGEGSGSDSGGSDAGGGGDGGGGGGD